MMSKLKKDLAALHSGPMRVRWNGFEIGQITNGSYSPVKNSFKPFIESTGNVGSGLIADLPFAIEGAISLDKIDAIKKGESSLLGRYVSSISIGVPHFEGLKLDDDVKWLTDGLHETLVCNVLADENMMFAGINKLPEMTPMSIIQLAKAGGLSNITGQHLKLPGNMDKDGNLTLAINADFTHIIKFNKEPVDSVIDTKAGKRVITREFKEANFDTSRYTPIGEWWGMRATKAAGVDTENFCLLISEGESGIHFSFIAERFDVRRKNSEIHYSTQDMASIMGVSQYRDRDAIHSFDMEGVIKLVDEYSDDADFDKEKLLRMILASVIVGNSDLHLKNISILRSYAVDASGNIQMLSQRLSPAYDVVPHQLMEHMFNDDLAEQRKLADRCMESRINGSTIGSPDSIVMIGRAMGFDNSRIKSVINSVIKGIDTEIDKIYAEFDNLSDLNKNVFTSYGSNPTPYLSCAVDMATERMKYFMEMTADLKNDTRRTTGIGKRR